MLVFVLTLLLRRFFLAPNKTHRDLEADHEEVTHFYWNEKLNAEEVNIGPVVIQLIIINKRHLNIMLYNKKPFNTEGWMWLGMFG